MKAPCDDLQGSRRGTASAMTRRWTLAHVSLMGWALLVGWCTGARGQTSAEEELSKLRPHASMNVSLFASEPLVQNPAAIDIDSQGRVWVAEIRYYRRFHDRPPADRIKVLEDTDGDGRADRATVFAEGVYCPMSICVAGTRVFVATSPDLWVYEDADGDLRADGPPTKLLTGFGGYNHDHGAHSLVLGPDHKWWMSHGDGGFDVTGTDGSRAAYRWGGLLRGELDGAQLEVVAANFRNPYEVGVSSWGESFVSDNDNDGNESTRICWILEGGNYGWFGQPPARVPAELPFSAGWHFRAHLPGFVPATLVTGFGSPAGLCFYEGDAFDPEWRNVVWHCDPGPREVRVYPHEADGYGMRARQQVLLSVEGDAYFRPIDVCAAPDGSLLVADWYDGGVGGHAYNNPEQGRIFRVAPRGRTLARKEKPGPYAQLDEALVALASPNLATQFLARERILAAGDAATAGLLTIASRREDPTLAARALWLLDRLGAAGRETVSHGLTDADARYRALAVRILSRRGSEYHAAIGRLIDDPSPVVRREVLLAVRRWPDEQALPVLVTAARACTGHDRYELETLHVAAGERGAELARRMSAERAWDLELLPLLQVLAPQEAVETVQRLLAEPSASGWSAEERRRALRILATVPASKAGRLLLAQAAESAQDIVLRTAALDLWQANVQGPWQSLLSDATTVDVFRKLLNDVPLQATALARIGQLGWQTLLPEVIRLARAEEATAVIRAQALEVASQLPSPEAHTLVGDLVRAGEPAVREAALAAAVRLGAWPLIKGLLSDMQTTAELRQLLVERLLKTPGGALVALRMIESQELSGTLAERAVSLAAEHPDANVRALFERYVPAENRPQRLGEAIRPEAILALSPDAARGAHIFYESSAARCVECHRVRGRGGNLGTDLSQIGRKYERGALLETILDPSKAMAPEFVPHLVETDRGQVHAGFLLSRNEQEVVLLDVEQHRIRIPAAEVIDVVPQPKSLMPELVLRDVTAQDAADLLAFLMSLRTAIRPATEMRMLGPFDAAEGSGLDRRYAVENGSWPVVDLASTWNGLNEAPLSWELVIGTETQGRWVYDTVQVGAGRGLRTEQVVHYFTVTADSPLDQSAQLLIDSDDGCRVWLNDREVHRYPGRRALGGAPDEVAVELSGGANRVVIKVENTGGPGGISLSVASGSPVTLRAE